MAEDRQTDQDLDFLSEPDADPAGAAATETLEFPEIDGVDAFGDAASDHDGGEPAKSDGKTADEPPKPADKDQSKDWDKSLQRVQQEAANERKKANTRIEELTGMIGQLRQDLEAAKAGKPTKETKGNEDFIQVTDQSDSEEIAKAIQQRDARLQSLVTEIEGLKSARAADKQELEDKLQDREDRQAASEAFNAIVQKLDKKHGAKYRTAAIAATKQHFVSLGYNNQNLPDNDHLARVLDDEYAALAAADKPKGGSPTPQAKRVASDPGSGGGAAVGASTGSMRDVVRAMKREGKL